MTPKEKANDLVDMFYGALPPQNATPFSILDYAIMCAKVCVDEIIKSHENEDGSISNIEKHSYWVGVKLEITK